MGSSSRWLECNEGLTEKTHGKAARSKGILRQHRPEKGSNGSSGCRSSSCGSLDKMGHVYLTVTNGRKIVVNTRVRQANTLISLRILTT